MKHVSIILSAIFIASISVRGASFTQDTPAIGKPKAVRTMLKQPVKSMPSDKSGSISSQSLSAEASQTALGAEYTSLSSLSSTSTRKPAIGIKRSETSVGGAKPVSSKASQIGVEAPRGPVVQFPIKKIAAEAPSKSDTASVKNLAAFWQTKSQPLYRKHGPTIPYAAQKPFSHIKATQSVRDIAQEFIKAQPRKPLTRPITSRTAPATLSPASDVAAQDSNQAVSPIPAQQVVAKEPKCFLPAQVKKVIHARRLIAKRSSDKSQEKQVLSNIPEQSSAAVVAEATPAFHEANHVESAKAPTPAIDTSTSAAPRSSSTLPVQNGASKSSVQTGFKPTAKVVPAVKGRRIMGRRKLNGTPESPKTPNVASKALESLTATPAATDKVDASLVETPITDLQTFRAALQFNMKKFADQLAELDSIPASEATLSPKAVEPAVPLSVPSPSKAQNGQQKPKLELTDEGVTNARALLTPPKPLRDFPASSSSRKSSTSGSSLSQSSSTHLLQKKPAPTIRQKLPSELPSEQDESPIWTEIRQRMIDTDTPLFKRLTNYYVDGLKGQK